MSVPHDATGSVSDAGLDFQPSNGEPRRTF